MENLKTNICNILSLIEGEYALNISFCDQQKNISISDRELYNPASIIKLYILFEALHQVATGKFALDDVFTLNQNEKVGGCGVLKLLHKEIPLTLEDLLTLMITISDNTATNMLLDIVATQNINKSLMHLGIVNTQVNRKLMKPLPDINNFTTAEDASLILNEFLNPRVLTESLANKALEILSKQQLNGNLSKHLIQCGKCASLLMGNNICPHCRTHINTTDPVPVKFDHKTGEISGHVHDAGILHVNNKRIIVSLLTKNLTNNDDARTAFNDIGLLLFNYLNAE